MFNKLNAVVTALILIMNFAIFMWGYIVQDINYMIGGGIMLIVVLLVEIYAAVDEVRREIK